VRRRRNQDVSVFRSPQAVSTATENAVVGHRFCNQEAHIGSPTDTCYVHAGHVRCHSHPQIGCSSIRLEQSTVIELESI